MTTIKSLREDILNLVSKYAKLQYAEKFLFQVNHRFLSQEK
jgi:septum formation topological specificity factor MinE